jgi:hypothetical protein
MILELASGRVGLLQSFGIVRRTGKPAAFIIVATAIASDSVDE